MFKVGLEEIILKAEYPDFKIKCMRPSHADYIQSIANFEKVQKAFGRMGPEEKIGSEDISTLSEFNRFIFKSHVRAIEGLEIAGVAILTADQFLELAPHDLVQDAILAVQDKFKVSDEDKKKS